MRGRLFSTCLVTIVVAAVSTTPAHAAGGTSYTWVGNSTNSQADNHSWTDQRNWNPVGVPGDGDSVTIAQPGSSDCFAHVDAVPTVSLVNFTLLQNPNLCTTSVTGGAITVTGVFTWNGGKLATPTSVGSGTISGGNGQQSTLASDLDVTGALALTGLTGQGALTVVAGTTLTIEPGASVESSGTNAIGGSACCTTPAKIHNLGTIAVDGGSLTISAAQLDQWATLATSLHGTLVTSDAPITTDSAGNYTGNGEWQLLDRSSAQLSGTQTLGPAFTIDFGGLTSTFSSTLSGTATLSGTGTFSWTGGVIEAALTIAHGVTVHVDGAHTGGAGRVLKGTDTSGNQAVPVTQINHGRFSVGNGATITTAASAHLVNAGDGLMSFEPGTALSAQSCCTTPDRLVNAGTVSVLPTTGSSVGFSFLSYQSSGVTAIAAGRTLALTDAPDTLSTGTITGGGTMSIAGPTAIPGTVSLAAHTHVQVQPHGSLDGNGKLAGSGSLRWTGGALSGRPVLSPGDGITASGADLKTVANVGGGSTPSVVRFAARTTFAAGTSQHHDVFALSSSRLVLAAPTTVGRFTEFDDGLLENDSLLSLHSATVAIRNYTQPSTGSLLIDVVNGGHGTIQSIGTVALHGKVQVHNTVQPGAGASIVVVKAQTFTGGPSCVGTSGTGAGGGHWAATHTSTQLVLHWRRGAPPRC